MFQKLRRTEDLAGYSFKPFDEKKAIFVHIPKCAGIAINQAIFQNLGGGHKSFDTYICLFEAECIMTYFKFTFVRNPWDRLVSAYSFLEKGGVNENNKSFFKENLSCFSDFNDFVKNWLNKENIWKYAHFRPQWSYLLDKGNKVKLDFIGFFENIEEDFEYIKKRIDFDGNLKQMNAVDRNFYIDYYTQETIDIVAKVYEEDINFLGYNFDNSNLSAQLISRSKK